ncbi:MAG: DUF190 domain-containing protein [Pseudomonadota bacterium]
METYKKKRIEIMVEAPLMDRVIGILEDQSVSGYTVLPAIAGRGKSGRWHRDGLVGRVGSVVQVVCVIDEAGVNALLEPVFKLVSRQIGIVTVVDVEVIRGDQF